LVATRDRNGASSSRIDGTALLISPDLKMGVFILFQVLAIAAIGYTVNPLETYLHVSQLKQ
jgi:hypothetical protein